MKNRKQILQLQNSYNVMSSDLAEQIIRALPDDQYEVTTAFLKGKPRDGQSVSAAGRSVYFDFSSKQLKGIRRWFAIRKLLHFCRENHFDGIICHRFKPTHIMLNLAKKLDTKAFVSIAHGFGDYDRSYRQKLVDKLIDDRWRFVGVSKPVQRYLMDTTSSMNESNTVAINNAIDIDQAVSIQLSREEARLALGLPEDRFIFGTIGRLVEIKGHAVLIDALAEIITQYPKAAVAIIGWGEEEQNLTQQIKRLGLEDNVFLLGKREEAIKYVKAFDVFTLPSFTEGLPLALLEGMSGALPVIGSDIDTIKPYIQGLGQVCKVGDSKSLAQSMEYFLSMSPSAIEEEGHHLYQALCERHNIDDFRKAYRDLLEKMLS
ncbi:glycosyltransferase [Endozoicomonas arenosclerae]|uniref:glycosyltransferase n=1 Tax=Endozoicomonas arenosclerae TaxID=1633495 RepID=UPI000AEB850A|nr:glycosyltransferase [Endozoicomonas arenosclerae]